MDSCLDLSDIFERMPVLICVARPEGLIIYKNGIARELLPEAESLDETPLAFETRAGASARTQPMGRPAARSGDEEPVNMTYNRSIKENFFRITRFPVIWDGAPAVLFCGLDHTEIKESERLMTASMYMDHMTGTYNRQFAMDILRKYAEGLGRGGDYFTICYLDINDFKYVNDNYGHSAGDRYIMEVVSVIKSAIRETDTFARIGGDEFLILFPKCPHDVVCGIMENIGIKLGGISKDGGEVIRYSLSYGVFEVREAAGEPDAMIGSILDAADARMYEMKKKHRCHSEPKAKNL